MSRQRARPLLYAALVLAFILRHDFWWWDDPRPVLGLPVGLTFHIGFCLLAALLMGLLVRYAWPSEAELDGGRSEDA